MAVRKTTNFTARKKERERRAKEIEDEDVIDHFHKFSPIQLYKYLLPLCNIDALRVLRLAIISAQRGDNIITLKSIRKRLKYKPKRSVFDSLIDAGLIVENVTNVFSCTMKVNDYSHILSMMCVDDNAPDIVDVDDCNYYRVVAGNDINYRVVTKRGKVVKTFINEKEASKYIDELYYPKGDDGDVEVLSKTDEENLTV